MEPHEDFGRRRFYLPIGGIALVVLALGVGAAIASQRVDTFEGGFKTERLELLPSEMEVIRAEEDEVR